MSAARRAWGARVPPSLLMVAAAFLFSAMGVAVKLASALYASSEIVMYRGLVGAAFIALLARTRGERLRTPVPAMHFWRSVSGVTALSLWFYAIGGLPLPTAMTLNYMSSVWMALFLIGGAIFAGGSRVDARLIVAVMTGFGGVALVLRPTIGGDQLWYGVVGLLSGVLSALAYLQVTALGRVGEPETRVVFYFSLGGAAVGSTLTLAGDGLHAHTAYGLGLLLAVGLLATTAQLLMTRAYATGRPLVNASLQYLGIAFSFAWGALVFDDPMHWMAGLGVLLIVVAGISAALLRQGRQREVRPGEPAGPDIEP